MKQANFRIWVQSQGLIVPTDGAQVYPKGNSFLDFGRKMTMPVSTVLSDHLQASCLTEGPGQSSSEGPFTCSLHPEVEGCDSGIQTSYKRFL